MSAFPVARGNWRQSAALAPLHVRDFRLVWCGTLVSQCGDQLQIVGLAILALNLTRNPTTLGAVLAAQAIPRTLFILIGGVVTDRFRPVGVLRVTNLLMTFPVGILAMLSATGLLELWHLYVYAVLAGGVYAFAIPAQQSIASELVPLDQVRNAVALNTTSFSTTLFLVPPIAGVLVAHLGSARPSRSTPCPSASPRPVFDLSGEASPGRRPRRQTPSSSFARVSRWSRARRSCGPPC